MNKPTIGAIAVSIIALILSLLSFTSKVPGKADDTRAAGENEVVGLDRRISSLEKKLNALASKQTDLAGRVEKPERAQPNPTLTSEQIAEMIDRRSRKTLLRALGKIRLAPDELPAKVREVATGLIPGSPIVRAEVRSRNGKEEYRLKTRFKGEDYDIRILGDARILKAEIPAIYAPQVVRDSVAKAVPGISFYWMTYEMDKDEGQYVYDVEGKLGGKKYDIIVTPDGRVIEVDGPDGKTRFENKPAQEDGAGQTF